MRVVFCFRATDCQLQGDEVSFHTINEERVLYIECFHMFCIETLKRIGCDSLVATYSQKIRWVEETRGCETKG